MSGHRIRRRPYFKPRPWRWGPAGWYCCGKRLMAMATLPSGERVGHCRNCGILITVAGDRVIRSERPGTHKAAGNPPGVQLTLDTFR